jgi:hypothetical protein
MGGGAEDRGGVTVYGRKEIMMGGSASRWTSLGSSTTTLKATTSHNHRRGASLMPASVTSPPMPTPRSSSVGWTVIPCDGGVVGMGRRGG